MPLRLGQIRPCDGACCKESPRFPNKEGSDCIYHEGTGDLTTRCSIQKGDSLLAESESPAWPGRPAEEVFQETCVDWPQNSPKGRGTGGCCWQWVDD